MGGFQRALSWLVVIAIGLAPILVYWGIGEVGRAIQRHKWRVPERHAVVEAEKPEGYRPDAASSSQGGPPSDIGPRHISARTS
jgi:hypothetical protein